MVNEKLLQTKNSKERILKLNSNSMYRKLKSSKLVTINRPDLNVKLFNFKEKPIKTNLNEKKQKRIKTHYSTILTYYEDSKENISSNIIDNKNNLISTKENLKSINNNSSTIKKEDQLINDNDKFKNEDEIKENKLKKYIENNNELLLSEEEFNEAYQTIKEKVTKNKRPVPSPIAITLGGQPGAGKSNIYQIARERFSNNIVELDCDAFRIFHPYYKQIRNIFGNNDSVKTNPFIFKVVDQLIDELSNEKYNLIMESSLNSPYSALDNGKNLPPKGYKVELQIMATPKNISWQGTIDRYNKELKNGGNPRAVSKEFHDKVVDNICKSLDTVKRSGLMDNIIIYDRNKNCLYDMKKDKNVDPCLLLYCIINGFFTNKDELSLFLFFVCLGQKFKRIF